ncbi:hypothetical protein CesoFtcFv8_007393 [Champsocephalus esox]|uniref:Uncharacterized protein n=1 Tax=Champsocephalus esox TaxID=159716 RepID=A0AAN8CEH6_9TELE|nr:hypothetical protein CesoFtcFv8_007393 [Champsocephalus esox]
MEPEWCTIAAISGFPALIESRITKSRTAGYMGNYDEAVWVFLAAPILPNHLTAMRKPRQHLCVSKAPHVPTAVVMVTGGRGGPEMDAPPPRS